MQPVLTLSSFLLACTLVSLFSFVLGYIAGRVDSMSKFSVSPNESTGGTDPTSKKQRRTVSIDESKVVVDVDANFSKTEEHELGEKSVTSDDITSARQKLSQLKRGK